MVRKRLYLHIGHLKTGTTAIQDYCFRNRNHLADLGILYPTAGVLVRPSGYAGGNHGVLALGLRDKFGLPTPRWYRNWRDEKPDTYDADRQWEAVLDEAARTPCDSILLSSEFFFSFAQGQLGFKCFAEVKAYLSHFDVRVIAYLRRPDRMLESFYNQVVKTGDAVPRLYGRASRFAKNPVINYADALEPWGEIFGRQNLRLRNYESLIDNDIYTDFFSTIQRPSAAHFDDSEVRRNPRIPNALIELKRLSNRMARDASMQKSVDKALRLVSEAILLPEDKQVYVLAPPDRSFLFEHTQSLNSALSALCIDGVTHPFFPEPEDILISPPTAISDRDAALQLSGVFSLCLAHVIANEELSEVKLRGAMKQDRAPAMLGGSC